MRFLSAFILSFITSIQNKTLHKLIKFYMVELSNLILGIIESPLAEKGYRELKKYYESVGMTNEAEAIADLIEARFKKRDLDAAG